MDATVNRDMFLEKLNALISGKQVVSAKTKCSTPLDYRRLKRFDVLKINDEEKLIVPLKPGETNVQYYVTNEELFSILHETHMRTGHGGRTRMLKELQIKYKNITYEVVMLYLNLCKHCQMKHTAPKKAIMKPVVSPELNSRCQVDVIDLQSNKDGEYKFIMVYQDHSTKFVQLRALKTQKAEEVADHVLSLFLTFGAPAILQSESGREFSNQVISKVCAMWKDVRIVHGESQTKGSVNQDVLNMIMEWMKDNNTNKWSDGLGFVQFAKNTTYHEGISKSPFEAMFGVKARKGLETSVLPGEESSGIKTEEQLEAIVNDFGCSNGSQTENYSPGENAEDMESATSLHEFLIEKHESICLKRSGAIENLPQQGTKILKISS